MERKLIIGCLQSIIDIYEMSKNEKPWANVPIDSEDVEAIRLSIEKWGEQSAEPCEDGMWSLKDAADALKRHGLLQRQEPCDKCEVGNPCLYCKHEFEPQEREGRG